MNKATLLARVRRIQVENAVIFTDDEVKGLLCQGLSVANAGGDWEEVVVAIAAIYIAHKPIVTSPRHSDPEVKL